MLGLSAKSSFPVRSAHPAGRRLHATRTAFMATSSANYPLNAAEVAWGEPGQSASFQTLAANQEFLLSQSHALRGRIAGAETFMAFYDGWARTGIRQCDVVSTRSKMSITNNVKLNSSSSDGFRQLWRRVQVLESEATEAKRSRLDCGPRSCGRARTGVVRFEQSSSRTS